MLPSIVSKPCGSQRSFNMLKCDSDLVFELLWNFSIAVDPYLATNDHRA